jgi:MoaA/NifB/PqqE/SkfB family radical SAM enzyme
MPPYQFANILFGGPCNLRCPYCIGRQLNPAFSRNNLNDFPLRNLDAFTALLRQHGIVQITFTGATTDPQLYHHEARLMAWLRRRLPTVQISLHTNGQVALSKMDIVNQYDRLCISFPSFNPGTYQKMTGSRHVPNLAQILQQARVPVKISAVVDEHNAAEIPDFLAHCRAMGVRRVVLRRLYGDSRRWPVVDHLPQVSTFCGNPVYTYHGMEITWWDFERAAGASLNLFSNGVISPHYLLAQAQHDSLIEAV